MAGGQETNPLNMAIDAFYSGNWRSGDFFTCIFLAKHCPVKANSAWDGCNFILHF